MIEDLRGILALTQLLRYRYLDLVEFCRIVRTAELVICEPYCVPSAFSKTYFCGLDIRVKLLDMVFMVVG